jgi:hypothetical protein
MRRAPALLLLLAHCTADHRLYVGQVSPAAGTCDPPSRGTLTMYDGNVQFAPTSGVLVLAGTAPKNGEVAASLALADADKRPYRLTLSGQVNGTFLDGEYKTKSCKYTVHLIIAR